MKTYRLTAEKPFTVGSEKYTGIDLLYKTRIQPRPYTPKSYREVSGFIARERGMYENGCVSVYRTKTGFAASLYKDGCFYPYYAKCNLIK